MPYSDVNLCQTIPPGAARARSAPLSPRMKAMLLAVYRADPQILYVGPGHEFQTCLSLSNTGPGRGLLTRHIYGEAPSQSVRVELTPDGRVAAAKLAAAEIREKGITMEPAPWPFHFSSRGYHLPTPLPGTK